MLARNQLINTEIFMAFKVTHCIASMLFHKLNCLGDLIFCKAKKVCKSQYVCMRVCLLYKQ